MSSAVRTRLITCLLATIMTAAVAMMVASASQAQTSPSSAPGNLTISPPQNDVTIEAGHKTTLHVKLTNESTEPQTIGTMIENVKAGDERGSATPAPDDNPFSLKQWMSIAPSGATLRSLEQVEFAVTISVPLNGGPGGHFASVEFLANINPVNELGGNVRIQPSIGTLIFVNVPGDVNKRASLASFAADKHFYEKGPIHFAVRIQDQGNVVLRPGGSITITDLFGRKRAVIRVDPQTILPDSIRRFDVSWKPHSLFSYYKATLSWNIADQKQPPRTVTFWAAPTTNIARLAIVAVILFAALWLPRHRFIRATQAAYKALRNE